MTDEKLKYLKNKISLELKDVSTQQGFEIICKRLDAAEKENAELKTQIEELKTHCIAVDNVNAKMKNCVNCKYGEDYDYFKSRKCDKCNSKYSKWELKDEKGKAEMTEEKRKKKVYISGQITGLDEAEYKALFNKAADILRQFGYEPVNPATLDETENTKNWGWSDYMKHDIKMLCDCDYIYLLPNWRNSKDAKFEYMVADLLNIPCLNLQDVQEAAC